MMSCKNSVGQIIKTFVAVVTLISLPVRFGIIKAPFDDVLDSQEGKATPSGQRNS